MNNENDFNHVLPNYPKSWVPIKILPEEFERCQRIGTQRNNTSKLSGWKSKTTNDTDISHIHGYAAEFAISVWFNLPPPELVTDLVKLREGDFPGLEVKSAMSKEPYRMNMAVNADHLHLDRNYVLCYTAWLPNWVVVAGWASGKEIKELGELKSHSGHGHSFYRLSKDRLRDIFELPKPVMNKKKETINKTTDSDWSLPPAGLFDFLNAKNEKETKA